jgi:tetratricopeptide (TPR) repeat protein
MLLIFLAARRGIPAATRRSLRIWILLAVAAASFLAQRELSRMDPIFFRLSVPGAKGLGLYLAGRYEAAAKAYREHWRAAIASGVTTGDPGTDLILGGDLTEAERLAQQEIRRAPRSTSPMLLLAEVALERGVPAIAARLAAEALESAPNDVDAEIMLSVARARDGAAPEAIAALNRALRSDRVGNRLVTFYQVLALTGTLAARPDPGRPLCLIAHYHRTCAVSITRRPGRPLATRAGPSQLAFSRPTPT